MPHPNDSDENKVMALGVFENGAMAGRGGAAARVFISYASKDLALALEVRGWLVEAGHEVFLDQDPSDGIAVGERWRARLHERLRWADAVVCVVTSTYLESTWCAAEIATAQERGSRLLPLHAEPGLAHPLLTEVQHSDLTRDPTAAKAALLAALHRIGTAGGLGWPDDRCPFPGLRPFDVDRHRVFFGRAEEIKQLAELVRSATEDAVLLVVGPSGCGKSSLVRAGLLPVLAGEPGWRPLTPILPGADPVAALARELAAAARRIGLDWTVEYVHHQLDTRGLAALVDELLVADPHGPQRRLLIVIDQFEELLTQTPPGQRARFATLLRPTLAGPVQVVATLRPEFLDQLLTNVELADLPTHTYTLRPLHREALRLVIEGPARLAGLDVDEHLVARLVGDTDTGEALPLLAFTLAQLADGVGRGEQLSATRYDQLGGVQGALTRQAGAALADAIAAGSRSREQVIAGLLRLVTVDEQGRPTRWRVHRAELPDHVVTELNAFVARRLLTTDTDNGTVVIGVAHEKFLSAWPPLAEAITANVTALRARRAVEHAATEWQDGDRPPTRLWGGGQLAAVVADTGARICASSTPPPRREGPARRLPHRHRELVTDRVDLSPNARQFLHASIRRDRSRRRRATTVLSVLLILALVGAGVAVTRQRAAQEQQRIATAGQLVAQAEAARNTNPRTALMLGIAAQAIHPTSQSRASLVTTLTTTHYAGTLTDHTGAVSSVTFSPDGRTLASAGADKTVILWDFANPSRPTRRGPPLTGHTDTVNSVSFSPDGRTLATAGDDAAVILWDITDPARPTRRGTPLAGHTRSVSSVVFSHDGRTLATASADQTIILWDLTDPTRPTRRGSPLTGHTKTVRSVAFSPDGRTLATGSSDKTVLLWDLTDPARPTRRGAPLAGHTDAVNSVSFSPDGRTLATAGDDAAVILWDITDLARPTRGGSPLTGHTRSVSSVAFSPDGRTLATAGRDNTVIQWDLTDPNRPTRRGSPLLGASVVNSMAFSPDGHTLTTASDDKTVTLWDLTDPTRPARLGPTLTDHTDSVRSVAFSSDGHTLATGSGDATVILWDLTDPNRPTRRGSPLLGHTAIVQLVVFSPDGRTLATAGDDTTVILWDLTDPNRPTRLGLPLTSHTKTVSAVAFAPDGRTLATASDDTTVVLWDLTDAIRPTRHGSPLMGHTRAVYSVAFSPDGHILATGSTDGTARLWDVSDPRQPHQLGTLTGHRNNVNLVAFSPDGRTLATASEDTTVILWDLTDPTRPIRRGSPLTGHISPVWSVAFSPDGHTLATASDDATVILWDLTDLTQPARLVPPLVGHTDSVRSVAFSPDGRSLATASDDKTVIRWDLTGLNYLRDHATEQACSRTGRGLDRDEWTRDIPGLAYQDSCPV